jgi:hypothetical protein
MFRTNTQKDGCTIGMIAVRLLERDVLNWTMRLYCCRQIIALCVPYSSHYQASWANDETAYERKYTTNNRIEYCEHATA